MCATWSPWSGDPAPTLRIYYPCSSGSTTLSKAGSWQGAALGVVLGTCAPLAGGGRQPRHYGAKQAPRPGLAASPLPCTFVSAPLQVVVANRQDCCQDRIDYLSLSFMNASGGQDRANYPFAGSLLSYTITGRQGGA
jgi:hypothetical protein